MALSSTDLRQYLLKVILLATFYGSASWLTLWLLGLPNVAAPVWFPSGIALAAVLVWGKQMWLGIFLAEMTISWLREFSWQLSLVSAAGSCLAAIAGAMLLHLGKFSLTLSRVKDVMQLIFFGALLSPFLNITLNLSAQVFARKLMEENFWQQWCIFLLGNSLGILIVTPLLLRLASSRQKRKRMRHKIDDTDSLLKPILLRQLEAVLCFALLVSVSGTIFSNKFTAIRFPWMGLTNVQYLEYLPFPLLVWTSLRFPTWGAIVGSLAIACLTIAGILRGVGPFIVQTPNAYQAILLLQTFMTIMTCTGLLLSVAILERQTAEKRLRRSLERDRLLTEQVQSLNANLERQVTQRTLQLQEKVAEVQQLYDLKTMFLQALSHDLRTSIMGLSMLFKNLSERPENNLTLSRSALERIIESSDRQLTLINALSEENFCDSQAIVLHCQPLSLKSLVENLLGTWQTLFQQDRATVVNLISEDLPFVNADRERLSDVFERLFANALKHNPPGINLTIAAHRDSDTIWCTLTDNGVGMNAQQCQQLFKLYVRSLHDRRLTGIGLGSYQCRQIIEAHGGTIGVNSIPSLGSQFWFTLPVAPY